MAKEDTKAKAIADVEEKPLTESQIAEMNPDQFAARFPAAYQRIVDKTAGKKHLAAGFVLDYEDPFADAILREYNKINKTAERLPIVLTPDAPSTPFLLSNYIIRAAGGCRAALAEAARAELKKIAAGKGPNAAVVIKMFEGKKK